MKLSGPEPGRSRPNLAGGTLSFAGSASASTLGSYTPVVGPVSGQVNAIDLLPGSPSAYGVTAGGSAQPAASWFFALNGYGSSLAAWTVGDSIYIPIFPPSVSAAQRKVVCALPTRTSKASV